VQFENATHRDQPLNSLARTEAEKKSYCAQFFNGCMSRYIDADLPWYWVRGLATYYRRSPDQLGEVEVRSYPLHLREPIEVPLAVLSWQYPRSLDTRSQVFPNWVSVMCVGDSQSARHSGTKPSGARWLMGCPPSTGSSAGEGSANCATAVT